MARAEKGKGGGFERHQGWEFFFVLAIFPLLALDFIFND